VLGSARLAALGLVLALPVPPRTAGVSLAIGPEGDGAGNPFVQPLALAAAPDGTVYAASRLQVFAISPAGEVRR
jgi:hypothetical protein